MPSGPNGAVQLQDSGNFFGDTGFGKSVVGAKTRVNIGTAANPAAIDLIADNGIIVSVAPPAAPTAWTLTLPDDAGASGQVLTTDGAGNATWETPAASNPSQGSAGTVNLSDGTGGWSTGIAATGSGSLSGFAEIQVVSYFQVLTGGSGYYADTSTQVIDGIGNFVGPAIKVAGQLADGTYPVAGIGSITIVNGVITDIS
jgi:hypothetical protein